MTEEEYFWPYLSDIYSGIKSKIQFISVAEDAVLLRLNAEHKNKWGYFSKVRPKHLVERIDQFKAEKNNIYQFEKYPEDEFWF